MLLIIRAASRLKARINHHDDMYLPVLSWMQPTKGAPLPALVNITVSRMLRVLPRNALPK
ncbi:MAG: hypothetical protein BZY77_01945 [SAR202 cluster bacterium Io17-Chloro-G5]|nr:MAG: hypothetical protein BZY77_01945 [SAR202 cluster bacterium Io17-Chloro-G5]